jgi:hypothetical protein
MWMAALTGALLLALTGYFGFDRFSRAGATASEASAAVLPFTPNFMQRSTKQNFLA